MCFPSSSSPPVPIPPVLMRGYYTSKNAEPDTNMVNFSGKLDGCVGGGREADKASDPIKTKSEELATYYNEDEKQLAYAIYGEAGGLPYADKVGVGWTIRTWRQLHPGENYKDIVLDRY